MKIRMLAGAVAVATLIATPALAQSAHWTSSSPHYHADSIGVRTMHHSHYGHRGTLAWEDRRSGFWPADVAAGVVGGAIGTAGAIASAPFTPYGDSYAYYGDSYAYYGDPTVRRSFVPDPLGPQCVPGQLTTINGKRMLCQ